MSVGQFGVTVMPWFIIAIVLKMVLKWVELQLLNSNEQLKTLKLEDMNDYPHGLIQGTHDAFTSLKSKIEKSLQARRWTDDAILSQGLSEQQPAGQSLHDGVPPVGH